MNIKIELSEHDLKELVIKHIEATLGDVTVFDENKLTIEVKSKQNYKSEWENASFRATYQHVG